MAKKNNGGYKHFTYKAGFTQANLRKMLGHFFKPYYISSRCNYKEGIYQVIMRKPTNNDQDTQDRLRQRLRVRILDFQSEITDEIKFYYERIEQA